MTIDPDKVANVIAEVAEEEIFARFGKLTEVEIDTKSGPNDFVTAADLSAEKQLSKALSDIYPGAVFIGEEQAAADPSLLAKLDDQGAFWIVDPLDGTRNFVQGREEFGTIVALVEGGETRAGWIYGIKDHACAIGEQGGGAAWDGDSLSPIARHDGPLKGFRAVGNMAPPWKERLIPKLRANFETEPARCSAYAYIHMARGKADFALYSRVHPWDHAAGALILSEIGGRVEYLDNGAPYAPLPTLGRPLLAAGAKAAWEQVSRTIMA